MPITRKINLINVLFWTYFSHLHKMFAYKKPNQITLKKLALLDCRIIVKAAKILETERIRNSHQRSVPQTLRYSLIS